MFENSGKINKSIFSLIEKNNQCHKVTLCQNLITFSALYAWQTSNYCSKLNNFVIYFLFLNEYVIKHKTYPYNFNIHSSLQNKFLFITFFNREMCIFLQKYQSTSVNSLSKTVFPQMRRGFARHKPGSGYCTPSWSQFVWLGCLTVLREHHHKWESMNWRKWWDMVPKGLKGFRVWSYTVRKFSEME